MINQVLQTTEQMLQNLPDSGKNRKVFWLFGGARNLLSGHLKINFYDFFQIRFQIFFLRFSLVTIRNTVFTV